MEALKLSITTIIFILLFIAPGAIFNYVVTRWVFSTGRYNSSKITSVIVALILSITLMVMLDRPYSKKIQSIIIKSEIFKNNISSNAILIESLCSKKIFDVTLKIFGESSLETPYVLVINQSKVKVSKVHRVVDRLSSDQETNEDVYFLIASGAILIIFSFIASVLLSLFLKLIESIIKQSYINNTILYFSYLIKFFSMQIHLSDEFNLNLSFLKNNKKMKAILEIFVAIFLVLVIVLLAILFFVLAILSLIILMMSVFITWLMQYSLYKILNLFKHPFHEHFFSYQLNYATPIVEIRTNGDYLIKGVMQSFVPLNHQELYALTISNVLQYHLQNPEKSKHFSRKARTMYQFENQESHLTIFMSNIQDINIWLLDSAKTTWKFEINSQEDIQNQLWYFRTLMKQNKLGFDVNNLDVKMNYKVAYVFMYEVVKSIESEYKTNGLLDNLLFKSVYRIKKAELFIFILRTIRIVSNLIRSSTLSITEIQDLERKKQEVITYIRKNRK